MGFNKMSIMKKKYYLLLLFCGFLMTTIHAQVIIGGRIGGGYSYGHYRVIRRPAPVSRRVVKQAPYNPVVYVSVGYGFPNLDANQFSEYYGLYKGSATQRGPVTASIDYRYSRYASIGLLATYGKVSVPYNNYYNNYQGSTSLENWSVMANFMQYSPLSQTATLYFREAIGVNIGSAVSTGSVAPIEPNTFAYQLGVGAKFEISKNTAFFAEAGYGKYILHGGLSFSFK